MQTLIKKPEHIQAIQFFNEPSVLEEVKELLEGTNYALVQTTDSFVLLFKGILVQAVNESDWLLVKELLEKKQFVYVVTDTEKEDSYESAFTTPSRYLNKTSFGK